MVVIKETKPEFTVGLLGAQMGYELGKNAHMIHEVRLIEIERRILAIEEKQRREIP